MYIRPATIRLITIALIVIFAGGVFLSVLFLRKEIKKATNPSAETVKNDMSSFSEKNYEDIIKRLGE